MTGFLRGLLLALLTLTAWASRASAQAVYTATGPGRYINVGLAASGYESDYGKTHLLGVTGFVDANLTFRYGVEFEARQLRFHEDPDGAHQSTYLVGPRFSFHSRQIRPYVKALAGRGEFTFPFNDAQGSYLVLAPGGGLDWRPRLNGRLTIRVVDFQYQFWPSFNYGAPAPYPTLHPYGITTGLAFRVF
jgi:hypothetical protein